MKRFVEEEDDSYESSTDSGDESDCSVSGENESDGESANPYADGIAPNPSHCNSLNVISINQTRFYLHLIRFVSSIVLI